MTRRSIIIFSGLYALCFIDFLAFGVRPSNLKGLLLLPGGLLFVVLVFWSLCIAFSRWKTIRIVAFIPLVACLLMLPVERLLGRCIRTELFNRNFPAYEAMVQKIETGAIPLAGGSGAIPTTNFDPSLAYHIWAARDSNNVLTVEFLWGAAGPPPYHQLYIYISSGTILPGSPLDKRFVSKTKLTSPDINGGWFEVAD